MKTIGDRTIFFLFWGAYILLIAVAIAVASGREPVRITYDYDDNTRTVYERVQSQPDSPATQPAVEEPAEEIVPLLAVEEIAGPRIRVSLTHAVKDLVAIKIRTKESGWTAGFTEPGATSIELPNDGSTLNPNWEYWIKGETPNWQTDEQRIQISAASAKPSANLPDLSTDALPEWVYVPSPPANALVTNDINTARGAIAIGRPVVLDGATVNDSLRLTNARNIWIRNTTFTMPAGGWGAGHSIRMDGSRVENINIVNCTFRGPNGDAAISGGNWRSQTDLRDVRIVNNDFYNVPEGIHTFGRIGGDSRIAIVRNKFEGVRRIGVELQEGGDDVAVYQNDYRSPAVKPNGFVYGPTVFAYSIATVETRRVNVAGNVGIGLNAHKWNDPDRHGMGLEVAGRELLVDGNTIIGPWVAGISVLSGHSDLVKTQATLKNNYVTGTPDKAAGWGKPILADGGSVITMGGGNVVLNTADWSKAPAIKSNVGVQK